MFKGINFKLLQIIIVMYVLNNNILFTFNLFL